MNVTLLKALAVLAPVAMLLTGSVLQFTRDRTLIHKRLRELRG